MPEKRLLELKDVAFLPAMTDACKIKHWTNDKIYGQHKYENKEKIKNLECYFIKKFFPGSSPVSLTFKVPLKIEWKGKKYHDLCKREDIGELIESIKVTLRKTFLDCVFGEDSFQLRSAASTSIGEFENDWRVTLKYGVIQGRAVVRFSDRGDGMFINFYGDKVGNNSRLHFQEPVFAEDEDEAIFKVDSFVCSDDMFSNVDKPLHFLY